jgi:hypothetical protein
MKHLYIAFLAFGAACLAPSAPAAHAADAAPADPSTVTDLTRYVPATTIYFQVNLDAGRAYADQMRDTRVGKAIQQAFTTLTAQAGATGSASSTQKQILSLIQGFGSHIGLSVGVPPGKTWASATVPDILAVIDLADTAKVSSEVDVMARLLAAQADGAQWHGYPAGPYTIQVLQGKSPDATAAYAVLPGALLLSSSSASVRSAIERLGHPEESLSESAVLQSLAPGIDRSQFIWGAITDFSMMGATPAAGRTPLPFDPNSFPAFKQMSGMLRGESFTVSLLPDRIETRATALYNPDNVLAQKFLKWRPGPLAVPKLAYGGSVMLADVSDVPAMAFVWDDVYRPVAEVLLGAIASHTDRQQKGMIESAMDTLGRLLRGNGGEVAMAIGPLSTITMSNPIPKAALFIQDGADPQLKQGIDSLMALIHNASGMAWYSKTIHGASIQILGPANAKVRPVVGRIGGFYIMALDSSGITTPIYLAQGANPQAALAQDPDFVHAGQLLGSTSGAITYFNVQGIVDPLVKLISASGGAPAIPANSRSASLPPMALGLAGPPSPLRGLPGVPPEVAEAGKQVLASLRLIASTNTIENAMATGRMVLTYDPDAAIPASWKF